MLSLMQFLASMSKGKCLKHPPSTIFCALLLDILLLLLWTHMLHTVDDLPRADLQNIDTRSTGAEDVLFIFADLKNINGQRC